MLRSYINTGGYLDGRTTLKNFDFSTHFSAAVTMTQYNISGLVISVIAVEIGILKTLKSHRGHICAISTYKLFKP